MPKKAHKSPDDIRKEITKKIAESLKAGKPVWNRPWSLSPNWGSPCNFLSNRKYSGINPLICLWTMMVKGYESKQWGTGHAWLEGAGAHIKKGEEATYIILFNMIPKRDKETKQVIKDATGKDKMIPIMKEFPIFNVAQVQAPTVETLLDGRGNFSIVKSMLKSGKRNEITTLDELRQIAAKYLPARSQPKEDATRQEIAQEIHDGVQAKLDKMLSAGPEMNRDPDFSPAEDLILKAGIVIKHGGSRAFYRPATDEIHVPSKRQFDSMTDYYQTVMHEILHSTLVEKRVGAVKADKEKYAYEELIAEIGSSFLLMELGVPMAEKMLPKSTGYVASWLKRMGDDPKFIFDAASQASKCVDYLMKLTGKQPVLEHSENQEDEERAA